MNRGDVVISPAWTYHDHYNGSAKPVIFVDGYDNGYNPNVNVNEKLPDGQLYEDITRPAGYSRYLHGHSRPISGERPFPLPPMHYPWRDTEAALETMREAGPSDPYEGVLLMFSSPVDGGSTLPTMAWQVQLLDRDLKTRSHRHNSTSYYHVFEGEGAPSSTVSGSNGAREISSACRRGRGTTTRTPTVTTPSSSQSMIGRP